MENGLPSNCAHSPRLYSCRLARTTAPSRLVLWLGCVRRPLNVTPEFRAPRKISFVARLHTPPATEVPSRRGRPRCTILEYHRELTRPIERVDDPDDPFRKAVRVVHIFFAEPTFVRPQQCSAQQVADFPVNLGDNVATTGVFHGESSRSKTIDRIMRGIQRIVYARKIFRFCRVSERAQEKSTTFLYPQRLRQYRVPDENAIGAQQTAGNRSNDDTSHQHHEFVPRFLQTRPCGRRPCVSLTVHLHRVR